MAQKTFYIETLGCPKNVVDSEKAAHGLMEDGFVSTDDPSLADVVIVNTCAFIDSAREESLATTLELSNIRKQGAKLVVTGCMAQRYEEELSKALPEADAIVGFSNEANIAQQVFSPIEMKKKPHGIRDLLDMPRRPPRAPWAYLKIAEGCNRHCAFCAIPTFRGQQRSRSVDAIVAEARLLIESGVTEIILVAQDIASYGRDRGGEETLADLMRAIDPLKSEGLITQRLMYIFPSELRSDLFETMLTLDTSIPYFDLSLQHAHADLLRHMKRPGGAEKFLDLISRVREIRPDAVFRSNFIVGFPGETEEHHQTLIDFLPEAHLTWTGFFPYSQEKDTLSYTYQDQVDDELARERLRELQRIQDDITQAYLLDSIGRTQRVLIDSVENDGYMKTRGMESAPEIDGITLVETDEKYRVGNYIDVTITDVAGVDRYATLAIN